MKNKQSFGEYFLGFDVGTNSVGWAATDKSYKLLRFNKKDMWGTRLFDEAETAAKRRTFRAARRRNQRRKYRISLLEGIFAEEISKVDMGFFMRLRESSLHSEDRSTAFKNIIFDGDSYKEENFYKDYPTIYHLRNELCNVGKKFDIRLLYLAVHHIIKYRGHFIFEGQTFENVTNFKNLFEELSLYLFDNYELNLNSKYCDEIKQIICASINLKDKEKKIKNIINDKRIQSILKLSFGSKVSGKDLFENEELKEFKISFKEVVYDDVRDEYESILGEDIELIDICKKIYDYMMLDKILKNEKSISEAKIKSYYKHQEDLKLLKYLFREYLTKEDYINYFRDENVANNYLSYINKSNKKLTKMEDFYKLIKNYLGKIDLETCKDREKIEKIYSDIELNEFLEKQRISDNGNLPYQVHLIELEQILKNQSKYHSFLNEISDGKKVSEKIIDLFKFRIPYYVGPLNTTNRGKNTWVVRKDEDNKSAITPWNFEEKVDISKSAEEFIKRMTNKCTYLSTEDVISKKSLLYSEFALLNELNKVKLDGEFLNKKLKLEIVEELFKTENKVTRKKFYEFLRTKQINVRKEDITGIDKEFNNTLSSFIKFKSILGQSINTNFGRKFVEKCILLKCLYGEDKKLFKDGIKASFKNQKNYEEFLNDETINKINKLKFKDWGRLSKRFLTDLEVQFENENGLQRYENIIETLKNTNYNLMEIINFPEFIEILKKENNISVDENFDIDSYLDSLYISPSVRRAMYQSYKIAMEIKSITKRDPKRIFVEMARGGGEKGKVTEKRKEMLQGLYSQLEEARLFAVDIEKLGSKLDLYDNNRLRQKKLFLYFMQLGKCMYSGESIDLEELLYRNTYDIDHIIPQSKTKDDSLDNTVLVKKTINAHKSDDLISENIRKSMRGYWEYLRKNKLITKEKFERLTRVKPFTDEELKGFEARQLVTTRQATKELMKLFENVFPDSELVYSKAGLVSDFREKFEIIKVRELNDTHHAQDAYLNIVVGNVHHCKYTKRYKITDKGYNFKKVYDKDIISGDDVIWIAKNDEEENQQTFNTADFVKEQCNRKTHNVTKMLIEGKGQLFDVTILKKSKIKKGMVIISNKPKILKDKISDSNLIAEKYGYFGSLNPAYFVIFSCDEKQKRVIKFDRICITEKNKVKSTIDVEKLLEDKGYNNPKFIKKILLNQKIIVGGFPYRITGFIVDTKVIRLRNDAEFYLNDDKYQKYIKNAVNFIKSNEDNNSKEFVVKFEKRRDSRQKNETYDEAINRLNYEFNEVFKLLIDTTNSSFYSSYMLKSKFDKLDILIEKFNEFDLLNKAKIIEQLLIIFSKNQGAFSFKFLKDKNFEEVSKLTGNMLYPISTLLKNKLEIVDESITGLFLKKEEIK